MWRREAEGTRKDKEYILLSGSVVQCVGWTLPLQLGLFVRSDMNAVYSRGVSVNIDLLSVTA